MPWRHATDPSIALTDRFSLDMIYCIITKARMLQCCSHRYISFIPQLLATAASAAIAYPALGQDIHPAAPTEDIVVTAMSRDKTNLMAGVAVMSDASLNEARRPSLGDTLASLPGVTSSGFGPAAARPVLRGLGGDRLRILTDGIGSFDASASSADHAVSINPMTADRIEVVRGPTALLYGSSAIGGVVNVIDNRIPRRVPTEAVHAEGDLGYGSAASERTAGVALTGDLGGRLVAHVDGNWLKAGDLRTGGYILSAPLRAEALSSGDLGVTGNATLRGKIANSAVRTWSAAAGLAWIDDDGSNIGMSVSRHDSLYGIPNRWPTTAPVPQAAPAEGDVRIDMQQWRYDFRAEIAASGGWIDRLSLRAGYADYRHAELGSDGVIGTQFFNKGMEARLDLAQAKRGSWTGTTGAQVFKRKFNVVGAEKFLPATQVTQWGLFTLQQLDFGRLLAEFGGRIERSNAQAQADAYLGTPAVARHYTAFSASAGAQYEVVPDWRLGVNLTHSERAPNAEELYANGPHAGTLAFEIGDPTLGLEKSNGAELTLRGRTNGFKVDVSAYYNRYRNFVYQAPVGVRIEALPVYHVFQGRAVHQGFEVEIEHQLGYLGSFALSTDIMADYVRATVEGYGPAPQIPPLRILAGLMAKSNLVDMRAEIEHVTAANRTALEEAPTNDFTLVNLSSSWRPWGDDAPLTLRLSVNNLFDVTARRHSSLLKDYAPLAGRDIRVGAAITF